MAFAVINQVGEQIVVAVNPDGSLIGNGGTTGSPTFVAPTTHNTLVAAAVTAAAPTAGTAVATLAAPPAGNYKIQIWAAVTGTATTAAADSNNMNVKAGATTVIPLLSYNCSTAGNLTNPGPFEFYRTLDGATNLSVNVIGNATTGTVYSANILATQVS